MIIIRLIFHMILTFMVYKETGLWTATSIGLMFLFSEAVTIAVRTINETLREFYSVHRSIREIEAMSANVLERFYKAFQKHLKESHGIELKK